MVVFASTPLFPHASYGTGEFAFPGSTRQVLVASQVRISHIQQTLTELLLLVLVLSWGQAVVLSTGYLFL